MKLFQGINKKPEKINLVKDYLETRIDKPSYPFSSTMILSNLSEFLVSDHRFAKPNVGLHVRLRCFA